MSGILEILRDYGSQIGVIGAAAAFIVGSYKYISERRETHFWKEFEVFHKLVKELVQPDEQGRAMYIDRQTAIMFELRYFNRYYPYSLRMLQGLKHNWEPKKNLHARLLEEIDLTIKFLETECSKSRWRMF